MDAPLIPPPPAALAHGEPPEHEPPPVGSAAWSPWLAPAALVGGIVLAAVGGLLVDIPALAPQIQALLPETRLLAD